MITTQPEDLVVRKRIPIKENVDVGDIYLKDNYFALLKLSVNRPTSELDTIFYDWWGYKTVGSKSVKDYRRFKVGPFSDGQILDSIVFRNFMVYDGLIFKLGNYNTHGYKIGGNGEDRHGTGEVNQFIPCYKYNIYNLNID